MRGYLPLIGKYSSIHIHGLAVYVKEKLPFCMGLISRNLCRFLLMFWTSFTLLSFLLFVLFYRSPSSLCTVFDLFHVTWMRFSQSTHLLMFLSLETLTFIIRTGLPILVELIDLVNSVIIFLSQMTLLRWLTFLLGSQTVILIVLLFWIYFFLLMLVFVLQWLSLHWEILIMWLSQFPLTFHQIHNRMPCFIA